MGLKNLLRPILPPTSRAFLNCYGSLDKRLDNSEALISELNKQIAQLVNLNTQMADRLNTLERQNEDIKTCITRKLCYTNLEYSSKFADKSPDILIAGWYGAENFGDELMLSTLLSNIPEGALQRIAVLLWDNYTYPRDLIDLRVTVLHYPNSTWEIDQLASHFSTLVWGGGAIVDDSQYNSNPDNFNTGNLFIRLSETMISRGKRVICLGLSSNDKLDNLEYITKLDEIVSKSEFFSLRDPNSFQTFSEAGVDTTRVQLCEDVAFACGELELLPRYHVHSKNGTIRIALVPLSTPSLLNHYVQTLNAFIGSTKGNTAEFDFYLIPFLNDKGHDTYYCNYIVDKVTDASHLHVAQYARSVRDLHLNMFDAVISYKYHSALIALIQGTPTLCIYDERHPHYKNKMSHLTHLFGVDKNLLSVTALDELAPQINLCNLIQSLELPKERNDLLENQRDWLRRICQLIANV